jgi:prepilin-type N-terminal cleavage/methylation domain-containing protein/prepilin-type processing-associated H-X9-DG protein
MSICTSIRIGRSPRLPLKDHAIQSNTGFTLVELLVVIGIIAVLISILLPSLAKAREQANRAQCLSNQKQIVAAILMYAGDNRGMLPGPACPCVFDPYSVNAISPATTSLFYQWGDTGALTTIANTWANMSLSSTNLLQNYLGGVDGRKVWQCPSSLNTVYTATFGVNSTTFANGKNEVPGYGYMLNNSPFTSLEISSTDVPYPANGCFFGNWTVYATPNAFEIAEAPPKKINQILAPIGPSQAIVGNADIVAKTVTCIADSSKTWLTSDLDGRNFATDVSGTLGICTYASGVTNDTAVKNGRPFQPVHKTGGTYGRNYAFLDGHAEYLLMNDWPDACYEYP